MRSFAFLLIISFSSALNTNLSFSSDDSQIHNSQTEFFPLQSLIKDIKKDDLSSLKNFNADDGTLIQFNNHVSEQYQDYWIYLILSLNKQELFPDLFLKAFERANDVQASILAQQNLGLMYAEGIYVDENEKEAFRWYLKAFEQFSLKFECSLAEHYLESIKQNSTSFAKNLTSLSLETIETEIIKNFKEAWKDSSKLLEQDSTQIQYYLGVMYSGGKGVRTNKDKAFKWYLKAAHQNHPEAQYEVGNMCLYVNLYPMMGFNVKNVNCDTQKAFEWFLKAAKQHHPEAQYKVGCMYQEGKRTKQDTQKAFEWFLKAAKQHHPEAQHEIGCMYQDGKGTKQDAQKALEWFSKAAHQNHYYAQFKAARLYENKKELPENEVLALKWYLRILESKQEDGFYTKIATSFIKNRLKKAVDINVDQKLERDFLEPLKILQSNLQDILRIYNHEVLINTPNSGLREQTVAIPFLQEKYQQLSNFNKQSQSLLKALTQADFMIDCLEVKDQDFLAHLRQSTEIKAHTFNTKTYLTFGKENVEMADVMMSFLTNQKFSYIPTILEELILLEERVLTYHQSTCPLSTGDYFPLSLKERRIAQDQICYDFVQGLDKYDVIIKNLKMKMESFEALAQVPNQLKELFEETQSYRNQAWVRANPIFQDLED